MTALGPKPGAVALSVSVRPLLSRCYQRAMKEPSGLSRGLISRSDCGAADGTRTRNRRFTKPLLYQLSYGGATAKDTAISLCGT